MLYMLRNHIELVREDLKRTAGKAADAAIARSE
jgi:hypothetical protein